MEDTVSAPAGTVAAPSSGPAPQAAAGGEASIGSGNAPGVGGDVAAAQGAADTTPAQSAAEYLFLNRKFRDQRHAEEILGSEVSKTRGLQKQNADLLKQIQQREAELGALRGLKPGPGTGQVQGTPRGQDSGPPSFADELAKSGELELIAKIAQDPEMGMGHAMYAMAQLFDKRMTTALDQIRTQEIQPMLSRQQGGEMMARVFTTTKELSQSYPEIADYGANTPEDIAEAQQEILSTLSEFPPDWLRQNPRAALRAAVLLYREDHGTPVFARPPGTSGSPSDLIAQAAERAAAASASQPLDGSGVPRQRQTGVAETTVERIKRENRELAQVARTPSGRPLGFEAT